MVTLRPASTERRPCVGVRSRQREAPVLMKKARTGHHRVPLRQASRWSTLLLRALGARAAVAQRERPFLLADSPLSGTRLQQLVQHPLGAVGLAVDGLHQREKVVVDGPEKGGDPPHPRLGPLLLKQWMQRGGLTMSGRARGERRPRRHRTASYVVTGSRRALPLPAGSTDGLRRGEAAAVGFHRRRGGEPELALTHRRGDVVSYVEGSGAAGRGGGGGGGGALDGADRLGTGGPRTAAAVAVVAYRVCVGGGGVRKRNLRGIA